jgi:Leucine-rich repeat (LRR) protein
VLSLARNGLTDLQGLQVSGMELYFQDNELTRLEGVVLDAFYDFGILDLSNNRLDSLSGARLHSGEALRLGGNRLTGFSADWQVTAPILYLNDNQLRDTANVNLPETVELILRRNLLTDIGGLLEANAPLLQSVDLRENCLDTSEGSKAGQDIKGLQERGIRVEYEPQRDLNAPPCR